MLQPPQISISIVSHGQAALVGELLNDLKAHATMPLEVILTLNIPEAFSFQAQDYGFPVKIIKNNCVKGFAENHNAAFRIARAMNYCVLNPDIHLGQDPFPVLLEQLSNPKVGVVAPLILNPAGGVEDSARRFPTPLSIVRKVLLQQESLDYPIKDAVIFPEWVAGMFMLFRSEVYRETGGFDEGYFLYYEDVDLCWRLKRMGLDVVLTPNVRAVHLAQRQSHRNFHHLRWHIASMQRFFIKRAGAGPGG